MREYEVAVAVSILVLMEVLREVFSALRRGSFSAGFNPCFNGSVERGRSGKWTTIAKIGFQSLF